MQRETCLVHGCDNKRSEGQFAGYLCLPCFNMLNEGRIAPSNAYFVKEIERLRKRVSELEPDAGSGIWQQPWDW